VGVPILLAVVKRGIKMAALTKEELEATQFMRAYPITTSCSFRYNKAKYEAGCAECKGRRIVVNHLAQREDKKYMCCDCNKAVKLVAVRWEK